MSLCRELRHSGYALATDLETYGVPVEFVHMADARDGDDIVVEITPIGVARISTLRSESHPTADRGVNHIMTNVGVNTATDVAIYYHGERGYSIDGRPLSLSNEEHCVLQVFLKKRTAMSGSELENRAGVANASRVFTQLMTRYNGVFKSAIRRPLGRGKGGYFARVVPYGRAE